MQTPAGLHHDRRPGARPPSWLAVIFNPSFPYRLTHMLLASGADRGVPRRGDLGVPLAARERARMSRRRCAPQWARRRGSSRCRSPPAHTHGLHTLEHQPAKIAAMEGLVQSVRGAPMVVFGCRTKRCTPTATNCDPHLASVYSDALARRRDQGPRRLRRPSAGGAGVFRFSRHGRHGHADALRIVARGVELRRGKTADRGPGRGWSP